MKILIVAHRHPLKNLHGGAEFSVKTIMLYLSQWHDIAIWIASEQENQVEGFQIFGANLDYHIKESDVVLTWGRPAVRAANSCLKYGVPYILMVRWWRNVVDVSYPIDDLMTKAIGWEFVREHQFLFSRAKAVITNNYYAAGVIDKYYGIKALVSYVPIEGEAENISDPKGFVTLVSPHNNLRERETLLDLATHLSSERYLVVNVKPNNIHDFKRPNVYVMGFVKDMREVWSKTKCLISPMYVHDICGTLRVNIEAQKFGVPVIANDRSGVSEKVRNTLPRDAKIRDWVKRILEIGFDHKTYSDAAINEFKMYNTPKQLEVFKNEIEKCV